MSDTRNTIKADPVIKIIGEEIQNMLTALAFELAGTMQRMIRDKGSIATGLLVGSVVPIFSQPAEGQYRVMVGTPVEYGTYVEFGCYSEDTEVLTDHGWKRFGDLTDEHRICTLNLLTGEIEYQKALARIEKPWDGEMIHFKSEQFDLLVTPDHRMVIQPINAKSLCFIPAEDVGKCRLPMTGLNRYQEDEPVRVPAYVELHELGRHNKTMEMPRQDIDLPTIEAYRLMGMFISEGHVDEYRATFTQIKSHGREYFESVFSKLPFDVKVNGKNYRINDVQFATWLHNLGVAGGSQSIRIPRRFLQGSKECLTALYEALMVGDGCRSSNGKGKFYDRYYTTSYGLAGDVQELALKLGRWAYIRSYSPHANNHSTRYVVTMRDTKTSYVDKRCISRQQYRGSVWCVTVPNGNLYVRRNGCPVFCGNSNPHWPPYEPIRRWVEMKIQPHVLSIGVKFEEGRAIPTRKGSKILRGDRRERLIRSVAYAIQRKIAMKGTQGKFFMRDSLEQLGINYAAFTDRSSGETIYQIDTASFLERQDLDIWKRISMRLPRA